ncbi:MAG: hypothetical protein ABGY95_08060 [Rubritalea sp.]
MALLHLPLSLYSGTGVLKTLNRMVGYELRGGFKGGMNNTK